MSSFAIDSIVGETDKNSLGKGVVHCKTNQIRTLILNREHLLSKLFYVEKGWTLKFEEGSSLCGIKTRLFTNYPLEGRDFERNIYQELKWQQNYHDIGPLFAYLNISKAGAFHLYYTEENKTKQLGSIYFIVNPVLSITENDVVPLDSIRVQTILVKNLGKFNEWEQRLRVCKESGYNMIHFTPIQELGSSNSSYCLKDQLKLNPVFASQDLTPTFDHLFALINKIRQEWKILSLGDIVLNHTANETPWLQSHSECTYNMVTSPYLIPAAVLDGHLYFFSKNVSLGNYESYGIPKEIYCESHLQAIERFLKYYLIPRLHLHEFYQVDVEKLCQEFLDKSKTSMPANKMENPKHLVILRSSISGRYRATVDMELALKIFNVFRNNTSSEDKRLNESVEEFKKRLIELNKNAKQETENHISAAINNCIASMRYLRLQDDGPKIREVSLQNPLIPRYFNWTFKSENTIENEVLGPAGKFIMAHNGWVMNIDPLKNFADSDSDVYLRRELIVWGDNVKLRYGNSYDDCPFLWDHMRNYVEMSAKIFDGLRLDNCHSTPLHVAEYLLDSARRIKPDLYVVAELFTNSDIVDNIFANRLGITAMIREASAAYNSRELGRLVNRFGGEPVGSFIWRPDIPLRPRVAHALFYDATHDNPSPIESKNVFHLIPIAAIISMSCCAIGSNRGFDELVPHQINVVSEKRLYPHWTDEQVCDASTVNINCGIIMVKKILNDIHDKLSKIGFKEIYVDQMNEEILAVTRHNPSTHESIVLVAHTAFSKPSGYDLKPPVKNLKIEAELSDILLEAKLVKRDEKESFEPFKDFISDNFINGLTNYKCVFKVNFDVTKSCMIEKIPTYDKKVSEFRFKEFSPGFIIILRFKPFGEAKIALEALKDAASQCLNFRLDNNMTSRFSYLNLEGLNKAMYRCYNEGLEDGTSPYHIPGWGSLVYCGIQGFESALRELRIRNDLGHPFCDNLRQGFWMLDYVSDRLKSASDSREFRVQELFDELRRIPKYLLPRFYDIVISLIHRILEYQALSFMSPFIQEGSKFLQNLALSSVQCMGHVPSAPLPPFSPIITDSKDKGMTMSAGLPHFSIGYMRSWGRDTFISLRGLLLLTGRFEDAKNHILSYAACLRHGLIPNLLDRGVNARYNCRDAVWWWLYAIISYVHMVPEGHRILTEMTSRIFPTDDSPPLNAGEAKQHLEDVMQEALNVHFQGLSFRERNAGPALDAHMTDEGFNNKIGVDLTSGFVFGGNAHNCGTWMDKMGSDPQVGNRGKPATPRDGSAIEIVALSKAVFRELHLLYKKGIYPYEGVKRCNEQGEIITWTFHEWENKVSENFEKFFWVSENSPTREEKSDVINRHEIYKDCLGSSQPWADYQLRPNFLIALTVAPEMMEPEHAWKAVQTAEKVLLGPLGIKTLDPEDWNYNGNYRSNDYSGNQKTAHGFNYHQGPEWLWLVGYFLRAKLIFAAKIGHEELNRAKNETWEYLRSHYHELFESPWRGLPELTNENGKFCWDGCRVQAWSTACLIEAIYDLKHLE